MRWWVSGHWKQIIIRRSTRLWNFAEIFVCGVWMISLGSTHSRTHHVQSSTCQSIQADICEHEGCVEARWECEWFCMNVVWTRATWWWCKNTMTWINEISIRLEEVQECVIVCECSSMNVETVGDDADGVRLMMCMGMNVCWCVLYVWMCITCDDDDALMCVMMINIRSARRKVVWQTLKTMWLPSGTPQANSNSLLEICDCSSRWHQRKIPSDVDNAGIDAQTQQTHHQYFQRVQKSICTNKHTQQEKTRDTGGNATMEMKMLS